MSHERILFFLGIWIALLSFLGFPFSVKRILFVLSGLGVCFIAYLFYKKSLSVRRSTKPSIDRDEDINSRPVSIGDI